MADNTIPPLPTGHSNKKFHLTEDQKQELREIFDLFDDEGTGDINLSQLRLKKGSVKDDAPTMRFPEFLEMIRKKMSERDSKGEILKAFKSFADEKTNTINFRNLKKTARELGEHMSDSELMDMITEGSATEGDEVTEDEFVRIMTMDF